MLLVLFNNVHYENSKHDEILYQKQHTDMHNTINLTI